MATWYFQYSLTRSPVPRISKDSLSCWEVLEGYLDFRRISKVFWRILWFLENIHSFWKMFMGSWVYQEAGKAGFSMTWTWGEEPRHWLRARKGWTDDGDRASPGTQSETKNKLNLAFFLEDCLNSEACSLSDWEMFKWEPVAPQWDQPVSWATRLVKTQRFKHRVKTHNDSNKG